jgi:hypothetical protein
MKFQTTTRSLRELVREFHDGGILLPQFQRDYVWKPQKIRNLLDSLLRGFPVGGFYFWRPAAGKFDPKDKRKIRAEFVGYLIDGQQRLTSLEAAFGLYTGEDKNGVVLRCYLDLASPDDVHARDTTLFVTYAGKKSVATRLGRGDPTLIPVERLFEGPFHDLRRQSEEDLRPLPDWDPQRIEAALARLDRAGQMLDLHVPCTTVSEAEDKEAVEVFSRLNKAGVALKQGDVRAAELARGPAVDVLKAMREFVTEEPARRLGFGFSFAFRALVLFHRESAQFKTLKPDWMNGPGPLGRTLADSWGATETAVRDALDFIDVKMGWSRRALVPSANAVIVLAAAFEKAGSKLDAAAEQAYRQWLCLVAIRGIFQGSVETTINRFHRAVRDCKREPHKALMEALNRNESRRIVPEEFNRVSQLWGPATQVMHAWLVSQQARDWLNSEPLDALARRGNPSLPGGDLTVHHLFARRVLAEDSDDTRYVNSPANYALLGRSTNSTLGDKRPDEVWRILTPDQRKLATAQFFGEGAGDMLRVDRYEAFRDWRAQRLAEAINEWLGWPARSRKVP